MPRVPVFSIHARVSTPFVRISRLNASSSAQAASTAARISSAVSAGPHPFVSFAKFSVSSTTRRSASLSLSW